MVLFHMFTLRNNNIHIIIIMQACPIQHLKQDWDKQHGSSHNTSLQLFMTLYREGSSNVNRHSPCTYGGIEMVCYAKCWKLTCNSVQNSVMSKAALGMTWCCTGLYAMTWSWTGLYVMTWCST